MLVRKSKEAPSHIGRLRPVMTLLAITGVLLITQGCSTIGTQKAAVSEATAPSLEQAKLAYKNGDYPTAARMLRLLSDQGSAAAQYALGYLHYYGHGVEQNTDMALDWFRLSAGKGFIKAREALQRHQILQEKGDEKPDLNIKTPIITPKKQSHTPMATTTPAVASNTPAMEKMAPADEPIAAKKELTKQAMPESDEDIQAGVNWLNAQEPKAYTIQLITVSKEAAVQSYIAKHNIGNQAVYFPYEAGGRTLYTVIYGSYETKAKAAIKLNDLPTALRQTKPWTRSFSSIQSKI